MTYEATRSIRSLALAAALLAVVAPLSFTLGCGDDTFVAGDAEQANDEATTEPVSLEADAVATVESRQLKVRVPVVGSFLPVREAKIAPDEAGIVAQLGPDESRNKLALGEPMQRGDVLLRLENRALRQQLVRSQGQLDSLHFRLFGHGERSVPDQDAELVVAMRHAETEYQRLRELAEQRAIPQSRLDAAEHTFAQARAAFESHLKQFEALEAEHELLQQRVEDLTVRAPFAGRISEVRVELGEHLAAGVAAVTLIDDSHLDYEFRLPERYVPQVRLDQTRVMPSVGGRGVDGLRVTEISPRVDAASRSVRLRARLENPRVDGNEEARDAMPEIAAGRFADATVWLEVSGLFVPATAVRLHDGHDTVFLIDEQGRIESRRVRRGIQGEGHIQILGNLRPQERILLRGQATLEPGTVVEIRDEDD